jgi:hypothetical protein
MSTEDLVAEYFANGGKITKLPDGEAEGALRLDKKDTIGGGTGPKVADGWENYLGTGDTQ